jgi:hypothetical protein
MVRGRFRWYAWWYSAISLGFLLLAVNSAVVGDRVWLTLIRLVIAAGFAILAAFEFRAKSKSWTVHVVASSGRSPSYLQRASLLPVAIQAQGSEVRQIAFPAAFRDRKDVVGIPKTAPVKRLQTPAHEQALAFCTLGSLKFKVGRLRIERTKRTDAAVATENLFAQIARVSSEPPFVYAPIRTERQASRGHFQAAPAAKTATIFTFR